jgi:hypothetical protein
MALFGMCVKLGKTSLRLMHIVATQKTLLHVFIMGRIGQMYNLIQASPNGDLIMLGLALGILLIVYAVAEFLQTVFN